MKILKRVIYFLTLAAIVLFLYYRCDDLRSLASLKWYSLLILIGMSSIPLFLNAVYFRVAMKHFAIHMRFDESFGLSAINSMYTYLLPAKTGIAVRAFYLKNKYRFPYSSYLSLLAGNYLIGGMAISLTATILCSYFYAGGRLGYAALLSFSGILIVFISASVIAIALSRRNRVTQNRFTDFLGNAGRALLNFKNNRKLLLATVFIQLAIVFTNALRLYIVFLLLDFGVEPARILFVQILLYFSLLVSLTPGNLLLREGIIAFSASFLSVPSEIALSAAVLDRISLIIVILGIGGIASKLLLDKIPGFGGLDKLRASD